MLAKTSGSITNATYQQAAGTTRQTAIRDLADLVARGVFTRHGAGRSAFYTPTRNRLKNDSIDSPEPIAGIDSKSTQMTQPVPAQPKPKPKRAGNVPNVPPTQTQRKPDTVKRSAKGSPRAQRALTKSAINRTNRPSAETGLKRDKWDMPPKSPGSRRVQKGSKRK